MGKRARWVLIGVVLLAVVGVGWMKARRVSEPIARWALADGTELRLQYVTYGTEHRIAGAGKIGVLSARLANQWLHTRFPYYQDEYLVKTDTPCPVLWFTVVDPQTGKLSQPKIESVLTLGQPGDTRMRTNGYSSNTNAPFPNSAFPLRAYPRRAESIRLRIEMGGQIIEASIPNPARGKSFEVWKPEPLPQTHRLGTREFTLDKLELYRWTGVGPKGVFQCHPHYTIREASGEEAHDYNVGSELLDATGNKHIDILPMDEPAWKIRTWFSRNGGYPFAADEGLTLGPVEMPGPGESREFEVPALEKNNGIQRVVIVGKHVNEDQSFSEPRFKLLLDGPHEAKWVKCSGQIVVRLYVAGNGYEMHPGGGSGSTKGNGIEHIEKILIPPWDKRGNRIPLSGPVSIQIVPVEPEIVEFIVAPPPLPAPR